MADPVSSGPGVSPASSDAVLVADPDIPEAVAHPPRRWPLTLVWLIPIAAVVFGAWVGFQALREHGSTITIMFKTAEGIEPRKTRIKYRNVDVGEVRNIVLSPDRKQVIVTAQITRQAQDFLVDDTRFWVVRPRISGGSVSGIGTLFSGSHIGMDAGQSAVSRREFVGLEQPAIVTSDLPGRKFVLHGDDLGSLDVGSPIYFRHIQVGQVNTFNLDPDGKGVTLQVFINAPYDRQVNPNVRFWHADGLDVTLDASGLKINTQSVVSILLGGLAFEAPAGATDAPPSAANAAFRIFADQARAMKPDVRYDTFVMVFKESVRGLTLGAPVDFRGVVVGEVVAVEVEYDPLKKAITVPVTVKLHTDRLRARAGKKATTSIVTSPPVESLEFMQRLVQRGLRGQLRTANLLTAQLYVALDFFPNVAKASVDTGRTPPELPTTPGSLEELQVTLAAIAAKLEKVPFDEIGADLQKTLKSANRLIQQLDGELAPEARATLAEARKTLAKLGSAVGPEGALQQDAHETLREIAKAAQAFRVLSDYLERHPESVIRGKKADEK